MKKILLFSLLLFGLSSCLDTDEGTNVGDRLVPFTNVTLPVEKVGVNETFHAKVTFSYNPTCEVLYSQYYYYSYKLERMIAPIAQVMLDKKCGGTDLKTITDSVAFNFKTPGVYTLLFYKGKKEGTDSATFFKHEIIVGEGVNNEDGENVGDQL